MINNIFSTFIYSGKCDVNLNTFKKHILDTKKKNTKGRAISNKGGWQSQFFVETYKYNEEIFKTITKSVSEIMKVLKFNKDLKLQGYWYNINKKCSFNKPHAHCGNNEVISGVFYIKTPKNCGNLVFNKDDLLSSLAYNNNTDGYNEYTSSNYSVVPKEKCFILFPSSLRHYVEPNLNNQERISISFNYVF
tara:strand:- start:198 stop:770 length:573 start_codon:yes stop_codon:yes gene_type:complete